MTQAAKDQAGDVAVAAGIFGIKAILALGWMQVGLLQWF